MAFADDLTGVGKIEQLKLWWDQIMKYGPYIGYNIYQQKSLLIVKDEYYNEATQLFGDSQIHIISDGNRHLGAVIGDIECTTKYTSDKVDLWIKQLEQLIVIAKTQPHAAYSAFVNCLRHRYIFVMRTVPDISEQLKKLHENVDQFIQVILNDYKFHEDERMLYSLPAKFGGMGIIILYQLAEIEYNNSISVTNHTKEYVLQQQKIYNHHAERLNSTVKRKIIQTKLEKSKLALDTLQQKIDDVEKKRALEASLKNGASIWLTALPLKEHGLALDKQAFWDAIRLRYAIPLHRLARSCVCGATYSIQYALSCPRGGFIINRHNEIRNYTAELLCEISPEVIVEPLLQPLTGEKFKMKSAISSNDVRADVASFLVKGQAAYADVRVFNTLAKSNRNLTLQAAHKKNENEKKRNYNERIINVEDHGSFTPLVFPVMEKCLVNVVVFIHMLPN